MNTPGLFDDTPHEPIHITQGAALLPRRALQDEQGILEAVDGVIAAAPLRHMQTPCGHRMSVAMTNCGALGWVTDATGYRYAPLDPFSGKPWPDMPAILHRLAREAASEAGFEGFDADACLINRYVPGARMSLHQDRNERDFSWPIVSVSLGLPATFQFGGLRRADRPQRVALQHGDIVVWGGAARLHFHGILALKDGHHPSLGAARINLTFRRAG
jgi:DNA oxidative demethylase